MSIGQIMAECDCTHEACAARDYCMAAHIKELTAQLAKVTEERDALRMQSTDLINDTVSTGMARDEALNQLDSERYSVEVLERRIRELLPRSDLPATNAQVLANEKVKALMEILKSKTIMDAENTNSTWLDAEARAALSAMETNDETK